jgi:hypothetical protein
MAMPNNRGSSRAPRAMVRMPLRKVPLTGPTFARLGRPRCSSHERPAGTPVGDHGEVRVLVDRDSVAMGDDVEPHERVVEVAATATLAELFAVAAPRVSVSGGSTWVSSWNGTPFAVWTARWEAPRTWDAGLRTVGDLPTGPGTPRLHHAYWTQLDAEWLVAQLRGGAPLDRRRLERDHAPLAAQRHEAALRERERTHPGRLFDPATVAALEGLGARTDVHTDRLYRCTVPALDPAGFWRAERHDTMTLVRTPAGGGGSFRPTALAQPWVVALVGAAVSGRGGDALPPPAVDSAVRAGPGLTTVTRVVGVRQELAQLPDAAHAEWFRRTRGRSVAEVAAAYAVDPPQPAPARPWWRRRRAAPPRDG